MTDAQLATKAVDDGAAAPAGGPPLMRVYTREGFAGDFAGAQPNAYPPDYLSVVGPHAPRRWTFSDVPVPDETDATALPMLLAYSNRGVRLRLSGRVTKSDVVVRNVEADELHFVQDGDVRYETDSGTLTATRGDFVFLPRSTAYRFHGRAAPTRVLIVESASPLKFDTPYPVGVINFGRDLQHPVVEPVEDDGPTTVRLRAWTGEDTVFAMPSNPLSLVRHIGGKVPVWKLPIAKIQKVTSLPEGGPPYPFMSTADGGLLVFNLGDRPTSGYRPPIHINADFDEVMIYVEGESNWGGLDRPGTLGWVPKGVVHHGVAPSTPKPHTSWMFECRATLRWTDEATRASDLMETGTYGVFQPPQN